jgi:ribonuclease HII
MRRALAQLSLTPAYALTDGFPVPGLDVPGLAVWKGDRVAACIAAASVLAKVTRDRIMCDLHEVYPEYDFATHKGYCTEAHQALLMQHGPCQEHRFCYVNVRVAAGMEAVGAAPVPIVAADGVELSA